MKSGNFKGFLLSEATPVKHERHEFQVDSAHTSSGKGDTAFQLYCQQNLSPINNFGFGKAAFLHSPGLMPQKNFGKSKSVFSPGINHHHQHNTKYNPIPHHHHHQSGQQNRAASGEQYPVHMKDEFDVNYHQQHLKRAATPLGDNRLNTTPNSGKFYPYQHQLGSSKPRPQAASGKHIGKDTNHQDYIFQSPVFKIRFKGREQLDLFLESEAMNRDQIDRVLFEGSSSKVVVSKQNQLEYENSQNSYQRVIQFNDENEEEDEQEQPQDEQNNPEDQQEEEGKNISGQNPSDSQVPSGVIQMPLLGNQNEEPGRIKSLNLFEEPPALLSAYDSQMTFNPYANYHEAATTTVKKPILEQQQTSSHHDLRHTASKTTGNQKRKLFDSPSFKNDRDLHTPSTKKKKAPSSAQFIPTLHTNAQSISNQKNEDEKQMDKMNTQKQSDKDQEDREFKQIPAPFALHATSSMLGAQPCEEKKICCNCKRTKCLKLYCECFAASRVCEGCSCQGCFNKPEFEHLRKEARNSILERNSSAFDPKIEAGKTQVQETEEGNLESDQKAHSKGCNCKKSNCLKKYCECFQLGVKCSKLCKCESCKNTASTGYSDDGDYQMSASAIKNSARKQHSRDQMNEYSQFNQFNYYHPNHYYPYYYPQYPYNQYPFMGDYYMAHPEDGERTLGNPIDTYPYESVNSSKSNKKHKFQQQIMPSGKKGMMKDNTIQDEGYYGRFPCPPLDKKRKIMEQQYKTNQQISKEVYEDESSSQEIIEENENEVEKIFEDELDEEADQSKEKGGEADNNNIHNKEEELDEEQEKIEGNQPHQESASPQHEVLNNQTKHPNNIVNQQQEETITFDEQEKEDNCCLTHKTEDNDKYAKNSKHNTSLSEELENNQQRKSGSKNKKYMELPKRELSKRGSAQKSAQSQVKNTRSQESNKKKVQQQDESKSEDVSDQEKEQPQVEIKNKSIKYEENRIVTRHSEEKAKNTVNASSRPKRYK